MENKKYEILEDDTLLHNGFLLYRIRALKDFGDVKAGDLGGYIEKEFNLSQNDDCWIYDEAKVYDNARVWNHARIYDNVEVCGMAEVSGYAEIYDEVGVYDNAEVFGNAELHNRAIIAESTKVFGDTHVFDDAKVFGNAYVHSNAEIYGNVEICGDAVIKSNFDWVYVSGFNLHRRVVSFFKIKDGYSDDCIGVRCGCFTGTLREFKNAVRVKYNWVTADARIYLKLARTAKLHFKRHGEK